MSRNVSVVITDDLDGSEGAETVTFGIDGASFEIDLSEANRDRLASGLAPFIAASRRAGRVIPRRGAGRSSGPSVDRAAVRAWARETGLTVSDRGRISSDIMNKYEAAH